MIEANTNSEYDKDISQKSEQMNNKSKTWVVILIAVLLLALIITGIVFLSSSTPEQTGKIRDIFIIFMALESLLIGVALIILIIQLAVLTNLIQNEVKPILNATQDTVKTLKGTTTFLSNNLVEPVLKLNEYLAALKKILDIVRFTKK